jgi:glutathione S-transferase
MRLESLLCAAEDLRHAVTRTFGIEDPAALARKRQELVEGPIKTWGASMEEQIVGPFAGGERISVADLKLFVVMGWFRKGVLDHVPSDVLAPFERLGRLFESVKQHPKVVEWYAGAR